MRKRDERGAEAFAQSIGSLTYFKDGRDFPDLLATLYEYDGVTLNLHCNQNSAQGEPIVFYGKEATMTINRNTLRRAAGNASPAGGLFVERLDRRDEETVSGRLEQREPGSAARSRGGRNIFGYAGL